MPDQPRGRRATGAPVVASCHTKGDLPNGRCPANLDSRPPGRAAHLDPHRTIGVSRRAQSGADRSGHCASRGSAIRTDRRPLAHLRGRARGCSRSVLLSECCFLHGPFLHDLGVLLAELVRPQGPVDLSEGSRPPPGLAGCRDWTDNRRALEVHVRSGPHLVYRAPACLRDAVCRVACAASSGAVLTSAGSQRNSWLCTSVGGRDRHTTHGRLSSRSLGDAAGCHSGRGCAPSTVRIAVCHWPAGSARSLAFGTADANRHGLAGGRSGVEPCPSARVSAITATTAAATAIRTRSRWGMPRWLTLCLCASCAAYPSGCAFESR